MKTKTKKILYRILKIIWIIFGISIALWTSSIYIKMNSPIGLGIIGWVILFTIGISMLIFYAGITLGFLLIKWIIKKFRKRNKKK